MLPSINHKNGSNSGTYYLIALANQVEIDSNACVP